MRSSIAEQIHKKKSKAHSEKQKKEFSENRTPIFLTLIERAISGSLIIYGDSLPSSAYILADGGHRDNRGNSPMFTDRKFKLK
jgi:hypothetical protein